MVGVGIVGMQARAMGNGWFVVKIRGFVMPDFERVCIG